MTKHIDLAKSAILQPTGITDSQLENILSSILGNAVDSADLFFQSVTHESYVLENNIIKDGGYSLDKGVGVRAVAHDRTGFAYSDDIVLTALEQAATAAKTIATKGGNNNIQTLSKVVIPKELYVDTTPLTSITNKEKIYLLQNVNSYIRNKDERVKEVIVSLGGSYETILTVQSSGTIAADIRPLVRLNITIIVEENGRIERATSGGGGRVLYDYFLTDNRWQKYADEVLRQALTNLKAIPAPAGNMPVVLGPGWPGVLLHEAVGHGLEGDFNRKGSSAYSGRIGEKVASELCTIVDDGTLENRRGSLNIDDEGVPTQCTTLIEKGILKGYMQDSLNAKLMGTQSTGNGRRESYAHQPMPRMTNTYMLPGNDMPEDIIKSVNKGLYAVGFSGGQVDITSGKFVFSASEAYLIEDGKITAPVKGATLIGNGPDAMTRVSMVGNDLELDRGVGVCGKDGQSVPVGVGQPTLKIDEMTVGGTEN